MATRQPRLADKPASAEACSFARPEVAKLVPLTARRILDVGCGTGALGASLKARGEVEVVGIEINPAAAAQAAGRLDQVLTVDLNGLEALPFPEGYFDCLILADVLEHLVEPVQVLCALKRYLRADGCLVISCPTFVITAWFKIC